MDKYGDASVRAAYSNFLQGAVLLLHRTGYREGARETFALLRERFFAEGTELDFGAFLEAVPDNDE
jgi:hypothetical protein